MYAQVEKPKENRSREVANSIAQKKSNVMQGFGSVGNRPKNIAQRRLQLFTNKSSHTKRTVQLKTHRSFSFQDEASDVVQRQTEITYTAGRMTYWAGGGHTQGLDVGVMADALLDPSNPKTGSRTAAAPTPSPYTNGNWPTLYQGHLLNANLGGQAISQNLFPVTPLFNGMHSALIEDNIKAELLELHRLQTDPATAAANINRRLHYSVEVINPSIAAPFRPGHIEDTIFRSTKEYTNNNNGPGLGTGVDNTKNNEVIDIKLTGAHDGTLNTALSNLGWGPDATPTYRVGVYPGVGPLNVRTVLDGPAPGGATVPNMFINL